MSPVGISAGEEKDVWATQEYIMSPCGEDFIVQGSVLKGKQQQSVLSPRRRGSAESNVTLLSLGKRVHLARVACSPKPQGVSVFQVVRAPWKRLWSRTKIPAPLEVPKPRFSHLKNGDNDTYLEAELGVLRQCSRKCPAQSLNGGIGWLILFRGSCQPSSGTPGIHRAGRSSLP